MILPSTERLGAIAPTPHDKVVSLPSGPQAPSLVLEIQKDPVAGWNLHVGTENFRFSPENASGDHVSGEGHAHVYVNGEKLARLYGNWIHIGQLPKGSVTVSATLNSNDHRALEVGGKPLKAEITVANP